jgi:hypothetical protein
VSQPNENHGAAVCFGPGDGGSRGPDPLGALGAEDMSEDAAPFGLPADVFAQLQPVGTSGVSVAPVRAGACQAVCCNQVDPYWWSLSYWRDSLDLDRGSDGRWEAHERAKAGAWQAEHGPWPKDMYAATQQAYWEGYEAFCKAYDQEHWKEEGEAA